MKRQIVFLFMEFLGLPGLAAARVDDLGRTSGGCKIAVAAPEGWKRDRTGYYFLSPTGVVPLQGDVDPKGGELYITVDPVAPDRDKQSTEERLISMIVLQSNGKANLEIRDDLNRALLISYREDGRYSSIRKLIAVLFSRCGSNIMISLRYGKDSDAQRLPLTLHRLVRSILVTERLPP